MDAIKTILMVMVFVLLACSPEIGSDAWCESMKDNPKGIGLLPKSRILPNTVC